MDAGTAGALLAAATEDRKGLRGSDAGGAMARLEAAYPRYGETFDFFLDHGQLDEAVRLAASLVPFWMATSRIDEGDRWLGRAVAADGPDGARARALYEQGYLIFWSGQYDRGSELSRRAVKLARAAGDATVVSLSLGVLARIALKTDVEEAKRLLREAIAVTAGTGDVDGRSTAMHVLGVALQMSGELEEARTVMLDRIALGRETGNDSLVAIESGNLSMVERQLGNLDRAEALSHEALDIVSRRQDELQTAWMMNGLAAVTAAQGRDERAAVLVGVADGTMERAGGEWPPDERVQHDQTVATLTERMAPEALALARSIGSAMSTPDGVAFALA